MILLWQIQTWKKVYGGKKKNGRIFGVGPLAKNFKTWDTCLSMRIADIEDPLVHLFLPLK